MSPINKIIAQSVGLWLAEGDRKTKYEITFTNNSENLIILFYTSIRKIFPKSKCRLYAYTNSKCSVNSFKNRFDTFKIYKDERARKTYYIFRLADRQVVKKWHIIVKEVINDKRNYPFILQGFFAGEGNLKEGSHNNRQIRITQKNPLEIIDKILRELGITYKFSKRERAYVINGRYNWEKLNKINMHILHPDKKERFYKIYSSFKEWHYSPNHIRNKVLPLLEEPKTSKELAVIFDRKQSRIQDVVIELKKEGLIRNFRVRSKDYWVLNNYDKIVISSIKSNILEFLDTPKRTYQISAALNRDQKSIKRRLTEMEKIDLVKRVGLHWEKTNTNKEVIVI